MKNEDDKVHFAIRNLMCMEGITLSREDIFHIARYAIENGIVNIEFEIMNEADSILSLLEDTKILNIYQNNEEDI